MKGSVKSDRKSLNHNRGSDETGHRESVFEVDENAKDFWGRMKVLWGNTCFIYLVAAGALRFFGGYSLGFLSADFFLKKYPDNSD